MLVVLGVGDREAPVAVVELGLCSCETPLALVELDLGGGQPRCELSELGGLEGVFLMGRERMRFDLRPPLPGWRVAASV